MNELRELRALATTLEGSINHHWSYQVDTYAVTVAHWRNLWKQIGVQLDELEEE